MRVSIYSNAPWAPTGYGTQTAQLVDRLVGDGHEVIVIANYGLQAAVREWHGVLVYPGGPDAYQTWNVGPLHRAHAGDGPGLLLTLYDTWVLGPAFAGIAPIASWTPVDSIPLSPASQDWARAPGRTNIAMSRFGERVFRAAGIPCDYVPHAIERVFRPTPSDVRRRMGVPEDAFLVAINAANKGLPPRKAWVEMLDAFSALAAAHDDAYLYMHTDMTFPGGMHIGNWALTLGVPESRMRVADQTEYRVMGAMPEEMAEVYTAADVLLATSKGEGFGIPVVESMACGTPAIVTDFSAQPELVGDTGWRVRWQKDPAWDRGTIMATPSVPGIVAALEAAYAERGTDRAAERSAAAVAKAAEYDADRVYAERWRPLLARIEAEAVAPPPRKRMSRGARRRRAA